MTKTCVVCKKCPISGDNTRSFHKFPFDEDIKKQWMVATGISKLTVNCTVCSDHFTQQSYHKTEGHCTLKRLIKSAVPVVNKKKYCRTGDASEKLNSEGANMVEDNLQSKKCQVRNTSSTNVKQLNIRRMFRYRDGAEIKYISREEFVTEEAWDKFLRLMLLNRHKMKGLRQKVNKTQKIINSTQQQQPAKKEDCNAEKYLEVILKD